jgi:hypothetical protein
MPADEQKNGVVNAMRPIENGLILFCDILMPNIVNCLFLNSS